MLGFWKMIPMLRRTAVASRSRSWPAMVTVPLVLARVVVRMLMVVVLPAPLGPRKAKSSPGRTCEADVVDRGGRRLLVALRQVLDGDDRRIVGGHGVHVAIVAADCGALVETRWRVGRESPTSGNGRPRATYHGRHDDRLRPCPRRPAPRRGRGPGPADRAAPRGHRQPARVGRDGAVPRRGRLPGDPLRPARLRRDHDRGRPVLEPRGRDRAARPPGDRPRGTGRQLPRRRHRPRHRGRVPGPVRRRSSASAPALVATRARRRPRRWPPTRRWTRSRRRTRPTSRRSPTPWSASGSTARASRPIASRPRSARRSGRSRPTSCGRTG